MPALGSLAFEQNLSPEILLRASQMVEDEESAEALDGFAHDLATIRALPEAGRL